MKLRPKSVHADFEQETVVGGVVNIHGNPTGPDIELDLRSICSTGDIFALPGKLLDACEQAAANSSLHAAGAAKGSPVKANITCKDPNAVLDAVDQAAKASVEGRGLNGREGDATVETRREKALDAIGEWIAFGQLVTVKIDAGAGPEVPWPSSGPAKAPKGTKAPAAVTLS